MNYLLAISGGVDSVVLLDLAARGRLTALSGEQNRFVVAHVDHGIRRDSRDDRHFVEGLARQYGLEFVAMELHLGENTSEERARQRRYQFLFAEAEKRAATILTAHHADDLAATVAINLHRGTGWRGLAVLGRPGIVRPLLAWRKRDIYQYAMKNHLEYCEDSTNADLAILRNQLRGAILALDDVVIERLSELRHDQLALRWLIDQEAARLNREFGGRRYPYLQIVAKAASELLRQLVAAQAGERPTRRETERLLLAIKTARPGSVSQLTGGARVHFQRQRFVVER